MAEDQDYTSEDENTQNQLGSDPKLSPREIQQRIRSGESTQSVAHAAGTTIEYAERFAAPIIDELNHILERALATQVITAEQAGEEEALTFGQIIGMRLELLFNAQPEWSLFKDLLVNRWIVRLQFRDEDSSHDARWWYEPKRQYLSPLNPDAENLSSVSPHHPSRHKVTNEELSSGNVTRFDSAAFRPDVSQQDTLPHNEPILYGRSADAVITELYKKSSTPAEKTESQQTEELLEDLEQQRGVRSETPPFFSVEEYEDIDIPLEDFNTADDSELPEKSAPPEAEQSPKNSRNTGTVRRGRQQVPSWDEIVFGSKPEEF